MPPSPRPESHHSPDPVDENISRVTRTLMAHHRPPVSRAELALALTTISRSRLYDRLNNEGASWSAPQVAELARFFDVPVSTFFDPADELVKIRNFSHLVLVPGLPDEPCQMDLPFPSDAPKLSFVG